MEVSITHKSQFFNNNISAYEYLVNIGAIPATKVCGCSNIMKLHVYKVYQKERVVYRCTMRSCSKRMSLYFLLF
jgi:hypothetical protein